jgi:hypothetical protein
LGLFSAFIVGCGGYKFSFWLSWKKDFTGKDKKIALFGLDRYTHTIIDWINIVFVSPLGFASLGQMSNKALRLTPWNTH